MKSKSNRFQIKTPSHNRKNKMYQPKNVTYPSISQAQHSDARTRYRNFKQSPESLQKNRRNKTQVLGKYTKYNDQQFFQMKEKQIVSRLLKNKIEKRKKKSKNNKNFSIKKNSISDFESLQYEILKPTDKFFQKLQNLRLAERILFIKPSIDVNRQNLSTFYKQQKIYEINIRRMAKNDHSTDRNYKYSKHQNKKGWVD